jgi:hypothetical protein
MNMPKQPFQDIITGDGNPRFRANKLVRTFFDAASHGKRFTLNDVDWSLYPQEDIDQFYQLIGYSISGYGELADSGFVSEGAIAEALRISGSNQ